MKWNKIVFKLGGTIMVLFLIVLLPLGFVTNEIFSNFYFSKVQEEVDELSKKYAGSITSLEDEKILNMFETLADLTNKEIYIIDSEGKVVANSGVQKITLSSNEIQQLSNGHTLRKRFRDSVLERTFIGSGQPINQSGIYKGAFFVLASVNDVFESIGKVRDLLVLSGIGAFFLALGFTFVVSKKMSDPLLEMEKAAHQIAKGNLDIRLKITSNDELGSLGKAINNLAFELNRFRLNRREFFANVSHELRTPISYLKGYTQVLKQELYQTEEEKIQYLSIIENETDRMTRLISDLFELAKMEEGKIDLHLESVDIEEIIKSTLTKMKIDLDQKGLKLTFRHEQNIPYIQADELRMEQIFLNLLGNAIRYTQTGAIEVHVWSEKKEVHVMITDTGIGIPESDLPYIFDRFHRVEKSRSREFGGTGLGLSIVKNLVKLQNGTISVWSKIGQGTRFELSFPIASKEES